MSKKNILLAITNGIWLINTSAAESFGEQVAAILEGKAFLSEINNSDPKYLLQEKILLVGPDKKSFFSKDLNFSNASPGSIAIISIEGPIMKHDNCGDPGTRTYERLISSSIQNPNISAIILNMDSPGGTVDGTQSLANLVGSSQKPIVAFTDGMIASGAYWVASKTKRIIASSNTAQIGSIGVASSFADMQPVWEKMGVKFHDITADGSEDKNKAFAEARKGNYKPLKEEILNPIRKEFTSDAKKGRMGKLNLSEENVLSGKVYIGAEAITHGLIDQIGTLNDAIDVAFQLAAGQDPPTSSTKATSQKTDMKKITLHASHVALLAIAGVTIEAGKDSVEVELSDDLRDKINSLLQKQGADLAEAVKKSGEATTALTTALGKVTALETEITTLKASNPGATTTKKEGEEVISEEKSAANDFSCGFDDEVYAKRRALYGETKKEKETA